MKLKPINKINKINPKMQDILLWLCVLFCSHFSVIGVFIFAFIIFIFDPDEDRIKHWYDYIVPFMCFSSPFLWLLYHKLGLI